MPTATSLLPARPALLVLDFDGVLTDNFVQVDENGIESVRCSKEDSLGLSLLRKRGFPVVILSSETNAVVARRAAKLKLRCLHGVDDKIVMFRRLLVEFGVSAEAVIYVGNDVNDLECLQSAGRGLVVADAHAAARAVADGVLTRPGGKGAVREVCDALLQILDREGAHPGSQQAI